MIYTRDFLIQGKRFELRVVDETTVITACEGTRLQCYEHDDPGAADLTYNAIRDTLIDLSLLLARK